ncbi:MAG: hypothetical protein ABW042_00830 [Phenylobacterium sp.]
MLAGGVVQAAACTGAPPPVGSVLRGPVLQVLDGEVLCIAQGFSRDSWTPVRLANPAGRVADTPPPTRAALMSVAFGRDAVCRIEAIEDGQAVATCRIEGRSVAEAAREPAAIKAATAWR